VARRELATDGSVAHLLKVEKAKGTRRLVRQDDVVDWELLAVTLDVLLTGSPLPAWLEGDLPLLLQLFLARQRTVSEAGAIVLALQAQKGGLATLLKPSAETPAPLTPAEHRHIRTLLAVIFSQNGSLDLAPQRALSEARALEALTALPGVAVGEAEAVQAIAWGREVLPSIEPIRRVATRLGALPAGLPPEEAPHFLRLPSGLPNRPLFDRMVQFAETTCTLVDPDCDHCPLRKLCEHGRRPLRREPTDADLTFVDLFAGAGGVSHGLTSAGLMPVLAVELSPWAARTYRINHPEMDPHRVVCGDITQLDPQEYRSRLPERVDLVVGGPPCQGFSLIGKRGRSATKFQDDPRNHLYKEFLRWVAAIAPRFVVMENVPGLFTYRDGAIRVEIEGNLQELGFAVESLIVDSSRFGVPQRRQRVLFLGVSRAAFGDAAERMVGALAQRLRTTDLPMVTLREALSDLPSLDDGEGTEAAAYRREPSSAYARLMRTAAGSLLFHHVARPINNRDRMLYGRLRPGETPEGVEAKELRHLMVYRDDAFGDKYRRLSHDEPGPTIMSHLAKDGHMFIHPDPRQRRSLTVREAARIQSFPDDFLFWGPRTHQFTQVGNAVPPLLARAIGEAIRETLSEVDA
jgi:DNA (cytosine-5)-methyltransferase 1